MQDSIYYLDIGNDLLLINISNLNRKVISKEELKNKKIVSEIVKNLSKENNCFKKFSMLSYEKKISPLLVTSFKCNYSCSYCYQEEKKKKNEILMPKDIPLIKKFYEFYCKEFAFPLHYGEIGIMGGEPLLPENKEILCKIISEWSNNSFIITTNGTYISEYIELIKEKKVKFKVSLDGTPQAHFKSRVCKDREVYNKTLSGIKLLLKNNIDTFVITVFDPENINDYPKFFDILEDVGWLKNPHISLHFIPKMGCGCDDIDKEYLKKSLIALKQLKNIDIRTYNVDLRKLLPGSINLMSSINLANKKEYEPYRCENLFMPNFSFLPDGTVNICLCTPKETGCIGRYKPNIEIDLKKLELLKNRRIDIKEKCKKCSVKFLCKGGCVATTLKKTGDVSGTYCELWKDISFLKFFEEIL